jgi:hypothetical protein
LRQPIDEPILHVLTAGWAQRDHASCLVPFDRPGLVEPVENTPVVGQPILFQMLSQILVADGSRLGVEEQ